MVAQMICSPLRLHGRRRPLSLRRLLLFVPGERLSGVDPDACLPTGAEALLNVREFSDAPGGNCPIGADRR